MCAATEKVLLLFSNYMEEFEYLINSGITIPSHAISDPKYPLAESRQKNLLKLYMNDVGMLTSQLYHYNIIASVLYMKALLLRN